jgi:hypothetical protein
MLRYGLMSRPWVIDSMPPLKQQSGPTMQEVWERHDERMALAEDTL